jgi:NADH-quinone oxidoreductase subunit G
VIRVTARRNEWNEVTEFICNTCRFEKKKTSDWVVEGPTKIARGSVITSNKYRADMIKPSFGDRLAAAQYKPIDDKRDTSQLQIQQLPPERFAKVLPSAES